MNGKSVKYLLAGILLFAVSSCRPKVDGVRVLSEDRLSGVLADVYLTDAMLSSLDTKSKNNWQRGMKSDLFQDAAYRWILDKHGITDTVFYASVHYYTGKPNLIDGLLESVQEELEDMQAAVEHRKAMREAEEERLAYERKWKTVHIDSAYIAQWAGILLSDTLTLERADSILASLVKLADICPDETTPAYWDSIYKIEAFILDSLRLDSLRLDSLRLDSLRLDSLRLDSIGLDSLRIDSVQLDSIKTGSI